jgi:hypothetical protein
VTDEQLAYDVAAIFAEIELNRHGLGHSEVGLTKEVLIYGLIQGAKQAIILVRAVTAHQVAAEAQAAEREAA